MQQKVKFLGTIRNEQAVNATENKVSGSNMRNHLTLELYQAKIIILHRLALRSELAQQCKPGAVMVHA